MASKKHKSKATKAEEFFSSGDGYITMSDWVPVVQVLTPKEADLHDRISEIKAKLDESEKRVKKGAIARYKLSPGTRWDQIGIKIVSDNALTIKSHDKLKKKFHYIELGFSDRRRVDMPDSNWRLLMMFAAKNGEIDGWSKDYKDVVAKKVQRINKLFKQLTSLQENPIYYNGRRKKFGSHGYKTKFMISLASHLSLL